MGARNSDPRTSHIAAQSICTASLEQLVLEHVKACGLNGATLDDLVGRTGLEKVTVSPRLKPLESQGLVRRDGARRGLAGRPQTVWKVAA